MNDICRICLEIGASVPLYQSVIENKPLQMFNKLITCTSVQVSHSDMMPKVLCAACAVRLDDAFRLREQAQRSDADLRHRLGLIKIEYHNESTWDREMKDAEDEFESNIEKQDDDQSYESNFDNDDNFADVKFSVKDELDVQFEPQLKEIIEKAPTSKAETSTIDGSIKITKLRKKKFKKSETSTKSKDNNCAVNKYEVDIPIGFTGISMIKISQKKSISSTMSGKRKDKSNSKSYKCEICSQVFAHSRFFGRHMRLEHAGVAKRREKKFMCDVCGNTFHDCYGLQMHKRSHSGDKPFTCNVCGQGFAQQCNMERHVSARHLKEKPFQCELCPTRFAYSSTLREHTRNHSGERRYPCFSCDKRFARRFALARHQLTHTKARPYICKICGNSYTQSNDLKSHVKRIHVGVSTEKSVNYCEKQIY